MFDCIDLAFSSWLFFATELLSVHENLVAWSWSLNVLIKFSVKSPFHLLRLKASLHLSFHLSKNKLILPLLNFPHICFSVNAAVHHVVMWIHISVCRANPAFNKEVFVDLMAAQIKTLSFLAYIVRMYQEMVAQHSSLMVKGLLGMLTICPMEVTHLRKELLIASRHILATDLRVSEYCLETHFLADIYIFFYWFWVWPMLSSIFR